MALEQGKHVFCEKPLCPSFVQAEELCRLAQAKAREGLVVQVGHSERFHHGWELLADSPVATERERFIRLDRLAPFTGRGADVDVVQDLMSHDLDIVLHIFGEKPSRLKATGFKIQTSQWDAVTCHFVFESGSEAIATADRAHSLVRRSVDVVSNKGHFFLDLCDQKGDHLQQEQEEFYRCIRGDQDAPTVSVDHARDVVFYMDKILDSLNSKREVIL